jgi:hypothetical protein
MMIKSIGRMKIAQIVFNPSLHTKPPMIRTGFTDLQDCINEFVGLHPTEMSFFLVNGASTEYAVLLAVKSSACLPSCSLRWDSTTIFLCEMTLDVFIINVLLATASVNFSVDVNYQIVPPLHTSFIYSLSSLPLDCDPVIAGNIELLLAY